LPAKPSTADLGRFDPASPTVELAARSFDVPDAIFLRNQGRDRVPSMGSVQTMKRGVFGAVCVVLALVGCGGSDSGGPGVPMPSVHAIDSGNQRVTVGGSLAIGPFALPAGATVTYTITDMPTGIGSDTMNFVVVSDAMVRGNSAQLAGYGVQNGVSSTNIVTQQLPADSYDLVAECNNLIDDCFFSDVITAYY
jgi:hypothetical protein